VVGREVAWEAPLIPAADTEALTAWWDSRVLPTPPDVKPATVGGILGMALERAACGESPVLRVRINDTGRSASLDAALQRIHIEVVPQAQAVVLDLDTGPLGVVTYDANSRTLQAKLGIAVPQPVAEIVTLDDAGRTVISRVGLALADEEQGDPLPLGGRLTVFALTLPPVITETLLSLQRRLVATLTGMGNNTNTAGFAERTYMNAERPGTWEADPLAPGGKRFVPASLTLGPGQRLWISGLATETGYAAPSINDREPSPPTAFTLTGDYLVATAYREARQLYALMGSDATASGESRRQATADFVASLGSTRQAAEAAVRWIVETVYAVALALQGRVIGDAVRVTATTKVSGTLPTMEELRELREAVSAKLIARSTYQTALGIADPVAEDQLIALDDERDDSEEMNDPQDMQDDGEDSDNGNPDPADD
jgi:hypothetical protein